MLDPPDEYGGAEREAYIDGWNRAIEWVTMVVGSAQLDPDPNPDPSAADDADADLNPDTCPDCGAERTRVFGGYLCPNCDQDTDADDNQ